MAAEATTAPAAAAASNKLGDNIGTNTAWSAYAKSYQLNYQSTNSPVILSLLEYSNAIWPLSQATSILDNGSGPGPVMAQLLTTHASRLPQDCKLLCADFSQGMLDQAEARKSAHYENAAEVVTWQRVQTRVLDTCNMGGIHDGSLSHIMANMVYFLTPAPRAALVESRRCLREGGALAVSSWEGSQWLEVMRSIEGARPDLGLPELPAEWMTVEGAKGQLEGVGFEGVGFEGVVAERVRAEFAFEDHEGLVRTLKMTPPMRVKLDQMTGEEEREATRLMVEAARGFCPQAPGRLVGWAIVAAGRK